MDFYEAYALERDREYVERLQAATVQNDKFALDDVHGLIGSTPWWEAVRAGKVETTRVEGEVVDIRVNVGGWPEFEIDANGESSTWALEGDIKAYHVGGAVKIDYVTIRYAKPISDQDDSATIVLGIWVET